MRKKVLHERGSPMCEVGFLFGVRQEATLTAVTTTSCLALHKSSYTALKRQVPNTWQVTWGKLRLVIRCLLHESSSLATSQHASPPPSLPLLTPYHYPLISPTQLFIGNRVNFFVSTKDVWRLLLM